MENIVDCLKQKGDVKNLDKDTIQRWLIFEVVNNEKASSWKLLALIDVE
jgi:hypothetical protein